MSRLIRIHGYMDSGYDGQSILVECSIRNGFPGFDIVGLPGTSVKEARDRVRCALRSTGFRFPQSRVLVNLSPAGTPKDSTLLDLPLAISILFSQNQLGSGSKRTQNDQFFELYPEEAPDNGIIDVMIVGELSLDGHVVEAPQAMGAIEAAKRIGCKACIIPFPPRNNGMDEGITLIQALTLPQAFSVFGEILTGEIPLLSQEAHTTSTGPIFSDVIGMAREKSILTMAVSGFHSILLFGPPGVGKTMLSSRVHMLLPDLTERQRSEVSRILGCANIQMVENDMRSRMRILSHDCTQSQFVCGRTPKSPGEGALSHMGTLVLDEINKYPPKLLETVKDAYDKGYTQSSRSGEVIDYPARFLMVGNLNPCPCGSLGDPNAICTCTAQKISSHWSHVGRQLIERFDVRLPMNSPKEFLSPGSIENKPDSYYLERSLLSSERQRERYKYIENVDYNGQVHFNTSALLLLSKEIDLYNRMQDRPNQSSRSQIGTITLARSLADYEDCAEVSEEHLHKAAELRRYGLGDYYWRTLI